MSSGSEGQHQDLNPVFFDSPHTEWHPRKGPQDKALERFGAGGRSTKPGFFLSHTDATAANSGSCRPEAWGPAAHSLRLSVAYGGDRALATGHSGCRPSLRCLLNQHEGATCRAARALTKQARCTRARTDPDEAGWFRPREDRAGRKEVWTSATRKYPRYSPYHQLGYPFSLLPLAKGKFFLMSNFNASNCNGSPFTEKKQRLEQSLKLLAKVSRNIAPWKCIRSSCASQAVGPFTHSSCSGPSPCLGKAPQFVGVCV